MNRPQMRRLLGFCAPAVLSAAVLGAQTIAKSGNTARIAGVSKTATTTHAPDEFGTKDYTVTLIPATWFTPHSNDGNLSRDYVSWPNGSMSFLNFPDCLPTGELGEFYAGVGNVPSGAVIDFVGLETYSPTAGEWGVSLTLVDRYDNQTLITAFSSTAHGSDTDYNVSPLGFQLSRNVHNQLVLNVEELGGPSENPCPQFLWIEIWWKRAVSPAPATASFNDVPTSDPAFQFIEALKASGITIGCGGGNYCPDAPLTRRQMAVFLSKGFGLHWPY